MPLVADAVNAATGAVGAAPTVIVLVAGADEPFAFEAIRLTISYWRWV